MKLTNQQAYDLYEALQGVRACRSEVLPIKVAYTIIHDMKQLEPRVAAIMETRDSYIKSVADQINEDGTAHIPEEKRQDLNITLAELSRMEVECNLIPLSLADLEGLSFSLEEVDKMYPIIGYN